MKYLFVAFTLFCSFLAPLAMVDPAAADDCQFVLGFKVLHDMIPDIIGDCLVNEHHNPLNGDGLQETVGATGGGGSGVLVWRKSDNWTAFTDGYRTWTNGPFGLQVRLNTERFAWEANPPQVVAPAPVPTPAPVRAPTPSLAAPAKYTQGQLVTMLQEKTRDQVVKLIGRPDDIYGSGAVEFWLYVAISYDPVTNQVDSSAMVTFYNGVTDSVTF